MKSVECQKNLPDWPSSALSSSRDGYWSTEVYFLFLGLDCEREICLCELSHGQIDSFHPVGIEYCSCFSWKFAKC